MALTLLGVLTDLSQGCYQPHMTYHSKTLVVYIFPYQNKYKYMLKTKKRCGFC